MSKKKSRTAEEARILFRQIKRELPEAERDRLIYHAGIAGRPDTAEEAIEFFKEMVAKLPSDELSDLNVEFRSGLEGQEDRIFVASLPDGVNYTIIPSEVGFDGLVAMTLDMWQDFLKAINANDRNRKNTICRLRERLQPHGNGPKSLRNGKEERNRFIDELIKEQLDQGTPIGQEDWVKIRDAVYDKKKEWLRGKAPIGEKPKLMDSKELKRAYRRDRPEYNEDCKKTWKKRQPPR